MDEPIALSDLALWMGTGRVNAGFYIRALERTLNRKLLTPARVSKRPGLAVTERDAIEIVLIRAKEGFRVGERPAVLRETVRYEPVRTGPLRKSRVASTQENSAAA